MFSPFLISIESIYKTFLIFCSRDLSLFFFSGMRKRHNSGECSQQSSGLGRHDNPLARTGHEGFSVDGRSSNGVPVSNCIGRKLAVQIHSLSSRYVGKKCLNLYEFYFLNQSLLLFF